MNDEFADWWFDFGSAITPSPTDDMESHARNVAETGWREMERRLNAVIMQNSPTPEGAEHE